MRALCLVLFLFGGCGPSPAREEAPPRSVLPKPKSEPTSLTQPASQPPTAPASTPSTLPQGAVPLGVVIRIDSFDKEDPLAAKAGAYVGLVCISSIEGLFVDGGVARGAVFCGVQHQEVRLTRALVTVVFSPK